MGYCIILSINSGLNRLKTEEKKGETRRRPVHGKPAYAPNPLRRSAFTNCSARATTSSTCAGGPVAVLLTAVGMRRVEAQYSAEMGEESTMVMSPSSPLGTSNVSAKRVEVLEGGGSIGGAVGVAGCGRSLSATTASSNFPCPEGNPATPLLSDGTSGAGCGDSGGAEPAAVCLDTRMMGATGTGRGGGGAGREGGANGRGRPCSGSPAAPR